MYLRQLLIFTFVKLIMIDSEREASSKRNEKDYKLSFDASTDFHVYGMVQHNIISHLTVYFEQSERIPFHLSLTQTNLHQISRKITK